MNLFFFFGGGEGFDVKSLRLPNACCIFNSVPIMIDHNLQSLAKYSSAGKDQDHSANPVLIFSFGLTKNENFNLD